MNQNGLKSGKNKALPLFIIKLLSLLLMSGLAQADVYKYVDSLGRVYYTDNPRHSGYELIVKSTVTSPARPGSGMNRRESGTINRTRYEPAIRMAARKYNLDVGLLHAVVMAESAYNPVAVSPKGAMGLMQLMPDTAARYQVNDPYNPIQNIEGGAHYLSDLIALFGSNIQLAVAAYNAGENNIIKYGNQIPPFTETREYVQRVLQYYQNLN
ncbi:MAG: transglycosylase SLT domain-containing protein [Methylococcaceae bacterium]